MHSRNMYKFALAIKFDDAQFFFIVSLVCTLDNSRFLNRTHFLPYLYI